MMNTYTIIKNDKLGAVVHCSHAQLLKMLGETDDYLEGDYKKSTHKLVSGQPIELTETEIAAMPVSVLPARIDNTSKKQLDRFGLKVAYKKSVDFELTQEEAKEQVDQAGGDARARFNSKGDFITEEYDRITKDVDTYRSTSGSTINRFLQAYATHEGLTVIQAVEAVEARQLEYDDLLFSVSEIRREAKAAIMAATGNYYKVAKPFINQLDGL